MEKEIFCQLETMQVITNVNLSLKEDDKMLEEYFKQLKNFFNGFDFMKLGQSINQGQW